MMEILIIDGPYKGCVASTFTKGGIHYFKDELQDSDILLSNHLHVLKDGYLNDIVYILNLARNSDNLNNFIESFEKALNKMKFQALLLRKNRIEKLYSHYEEIETKLFELLKNNKDDEIVFNIIIQYLSNIKEDNKMEELKDLNKCFCESTLTNFIALENKGYKRAFHRPFEDDDILFIENNEIKTFERKNLVNYAQGFFLNREISFNNDTREFEFIKKNKKEEK